MTAEVNPAVAAVVVVQGGRVLLVRRRVSEGALSWRFPAGRIESGECGGGGGARGPGGGRAAGDFPDCARAVGSPP
ncbi:NUDIX hydrolase [Streptomyces violaceoruber]|uniref:NUDIX hydrolase n=1 Tax=Streptomyces violaceoruber TaxID=1935 RepID=UPI003B4380C3